MKKQIVKSVVYFILGALLVLSGVISPLAPVSTAQGVTNTAISPPAGWCKLQDLNVFRTDNPTGWAGGDGLETINGGLLPVDENETYHGLPSLRINVTNNPSWWWMAIIVWRSWATTNLESYYENGAIEFNVKGASGGEQFNVAIQDRANERYINGQLTESVEVQKPVTNYINITTEWQHVVIPLKSLIDPNSGFVLKQAWYITLRNAATTSMKVWVNDIRFTSPDNEPNFPAIKVNQVGYPIWGEKYGLVSGFDGVLTAAAGTPFLVKRAADGKVVYRGALALVSDYEPVISGERVLKADFSRLIIPDTYYISVQANGIQDSPSFKIGWDVYAPLLVDASRYYYYQRANLKLESRYAGDFARDDYSPADFNAPLQSNPGGPVKDVSGGWYDAGDFGKYTSAGATAISRLLWAYETVPFVFRDNQFNIPESGNGMPDILDEAKYELDFLLKMQDTDGGFYHRVFPQEPFTARNISDVVGSATNVKPTPHTGSCAAILAHASVVYRRWNPAYAATLLDAARKGWNYLELHPEVIESPGGPYYDNYDKDDRFWAAGALYRATGEPKYNRYFKESYESFAGIFDNPGNAMSQEFFAYMNYLKSGCPDGAAVSWFRTKFRNWRDIQLKRYRAAVWHNTLQDNYYWGGNMAALDVSMALVVGSLLTRDIKLEIIEVVQGNFNYILGVNPLAFSYVSGYGKYCCANSYSGIYNIDGKPGIPKGYMAGGANQYEGRWFSRFNGKCYNDVNTEWTTNEHTIYWNGALVFNAAILSVGSNLSSLLQ
jgi:hypothetical protein